MKLGIVICALMVLTVTSAFGDVYQWTDEKGVISFTDDADRIPAKYRKKARKVVSDPVSSAPATVPSPTPASPESAQPSISRESHLYGGHGEDWWRGRFRESREKLQAIQDALPAKRTQLEQVARQRTIYTRTRDRLAYNTLKTEIEQDETTIVSLQKQLEDLEQQASTAGVPFDWRK